MVDVVWRLLLDRAGGPIRLPITQDARMTLALDGVNVLPVMRRDDVAIFCLERRFDQVRLLSLSAVPSELGLARDARELGIALRRLVVRQGTRFRIVEADDARLTDGFHMFEPDNGMRWTNGDAALPATLFNGFAGSFDLVSHLGGATHYIDDRAVLSVA